MKEFYIIIFLFISIFIITDANAENKKLSARAAANDKNGDGLLQKSEAKLNVKANFDVIDCDKNKGLDGEEIRNFLNGKKCGTQLASAYIYHEKIYPAGPGPFPGIIVLHSSGGFRGSNLLIENFRSETWIKAGYAWYAPNFFAKHGITNRNRMDTFNKYRKGIEKELAAIVALMKDDPKIDSNNIFAIGFSNGGFWASYLASKNLVAAASSHYGVWRANTGREWTNLYPMKYFSSKSSPVLALHGKGDSTQRIKFMRAAISKIKKKYKYEIEEHIYDNAGHVWDCFPSSPEGKQICKKFDTPKREITNDALNRTLAFFKKHSR
tara:strand:+ start:572 stop:1543 length:972 start_codon:yes stop_codon:yes gene_type:complete